MPWPWRSAGRSRPTRKSRDRAQPKGEHWCRSRRSPPPSWRCIRRCVNKASTNPNWRAGLEYRKPLRAASSASTTIRASIAYRRRLRYWTGARSWKTQPDQAMTDRDRFFHRGDRGEGAPPSISAPRRHHHRQRLRFDKDSLREETVSQTHLRTPRESIACARARVPLAVEPRVAPAPSTVSPDCIRALPTPTGSTRGRRALDERTVSPPRLQPAISETSAYAEGVITTRIR